MIRVNEHWFRAGEILLHDPSFIVEQQGRIKDSAGFAGNRREG
ncbi:MAG: hypothetical protein V8R95_12440 [Faecalibacterium sp.]